MVTIAHGEMLYLVFLKGVFLALCFSFCTPMICGLDLEICFLLKQMMLLCQQLSSVAPAEISLGRGALFHITQSPPRQINKDPVPNFLRGQRAQKHHFLFFGGSGEGGAKDELANDASLFSRGVLGGAVSTPEKIF